MPVIVRVEGTLAVEVTIGDAVGELVMIILCTMYGVMVGVGVGETVVIRSL